MINFHIPEIADKPKIDAAFFNSNCRSDDYCFGNLFIWRNHFKTRVAFLGELPLVAFDDGPHNLARYLFPIGNGNKKEAIHILFEQPDARRPFTFAGVTDEMKMEIEELFPEKFSFELNRNQCDYIYEIEKMITLSGRKMHGKRNHVARFKRKEWSFEPITAENISICEELNNEWYERNFSVENLTLQREHQAVREAFLNFEALGFSGGLLRQEGVPVAFTIGEPIFQDTYGVHIEKAFSDIEGAYAAINREFLNFAASDFQYVNREEDMGDEGLRKAKMSYHPAILLNKYTATLKEGETL